MTSEHAADGLSTSLSHRIPVLASRVRAQLLFMVLDAACVVAGYSAAEVFYWRNVAPTAYGWHFELFVLIVMIVTLDLQSDLRPVRPHVAPCRARRSTSDDPLERDGGRRPARHLHGHPTCRISGGAPQVVVVGLILATLGMSLIRFQSRIFAWQRGSRGSGLRVAIVGSRDAAASAVREMIRHPDAGLIPVAVFDDDTSVHGMSLIGVPIVGSIRDIPAATSRYMLQEVLLAIPDASPEMIADVLHTTEAAGITMKVLPTVHDVVTGRTGMFAIRTGTRAEHRGPLGPYPGRDRPRGGSHVTRVPPGAGHRCRRLHRFGDLPPGRRVRSRPARSSSTTTRPTFTTPRPCSTVPVTRPSSTSTTVKRSSRCSSGTDPMSCSTRPPTSMFRFSRTTRSRRLAPTCSERST